MSMIVISAAFGLAGGATENAIIVIDTPAEWQIEDIDVVGWPVAETGQEMLRSSVGRVMVGRAAIAKEFGSAVVRVDRELNEQEEFSVCCECGCKCGALADQFRETAYCAECANHLLGSTEDMSSIKEDQ